MFTIPKSPTASHLETISSSTGCSFKGLALAREGSPSSITFAFLNAGSSSSVLTSSQVSQHGKANLTQAALASVVFGFTCWTMPPNCRFTQPPSSLFTTSVLIPQQSLKVMLNHGLACTASCAQSSTCMKGYCLSSRKSFTFCFCSAPSAFSCCVLSSIHVRLSVTNLGTSAPSSEMLTVFRQCPDASAL